MTKKTIALMTAAALGFAAIAYLITSGQAEAFDLAVQSLVFKARCGWLTAIAVPFSYTGNWQFVTPVCAIILAIKKSRVRYGLPLSVTALTSVAFYQGFKYLFKRPRPDIALHLLVQGGYSFPSGHSQTSMAVWGMLFLLLCFYKKEDKRLPLWKTLIVLYIVLMGLSRVYVGVHWPTDILGGWCIAIFIICIMRAIFLKKAPENGSDETSPKTDKA